MLDELGACLQNHPDTRYLDAFYCDLSCVMRGKRYPVAQAEKIVQNGLMSPGGSFALAVTGDCLDPCGMGISDGDPDQHAVPVPGTLVPSPWTHSPTTQVLLTCQELDGTPYYYEPRNVLRRVLEKIGEHSLTPVVAFELEFYLFDLERDAKGNLQGARSPLTGERHASTQVYSLQDVEDFAPFFDEVMLACDIQGLKTGAITSEYSPSQFEINLHHDGDALRAADHCVMFKRLIQGVARKHGMRASFMAKPSIDNAGSGMHLHISIVNQDNANVFDGGGDFGDLNCMSGLMQNATAGLIETMPDAIAVFAPNLNSYRRFQPDIYVPVQANWSFENRSTAVRVPKGHGNARRIEHRVAGAEANPYLTLAAALTGMDYGIRHKKPLPPQTVGNGCQSVDKNLPFELTRAMQQLDQSPIFKHYFGEKYIELYTQCKLKEFEALTEASVDAELNWYL